MTLFSPKTLFEVGALIILILKMRKAVQRGSIHCVSERVEASSEPQQNHCRAQLLSCMSTSNMQKLKMSFTQVFLERLLKDELLSKK